MRYSLVTAPASEPISTTEACNYLKIGAYASLPTAEQTLINTLIETARREAEIYTWGAIISQVWDLYLDNWKREIDIYKAPVTTISSIKYQDSNATEQTLSASLYQKATSNHLGECGRIYIHGTLPTLDQDNRLDRVVIRFTCGYADADSVPENVIDAMLLRIADLYEHRQTIHTGTQVHHHPEWYDMVLNGYKFPHV